MIPCARLEERSPGVVVNYRKIMKAGLKADEWSNAKRRKGAKGQTRERERQWERYAERRRGESPPPPELVRVWRRDEAQSESPPVAFINVARSCGSLACRITPCNIRVASYLSHHNHPLPWLAYSHTHTGKIGACTQLEPPARTPMNRSDQLGRFAFT